MYYKTPDNKLHDDMGGEALNLPSWPIDAVAISDEEAEALRPKPPEPDPKAVALAEIRALEAPLDDDFKKVTRQFMLGYLVKETKALMPTATSEQVHAYLYQKNKTYNILFDLEQKIIPIRTRL